jgi:RecJ-like exonuclease
MRVIIEDAVVIQRHKKDGSGTFFMVEIQEPVTKFINGEDAAADAYLSRLASEGKPVTLELFLKGKNLVFSSN